MECVAHPLVAFGRLVDQVTAVCLVEVPFPEVDRLDIEEVVDIVHLVDHCMAAEEKRIRGRSDPAEVAGHMHHIAAVEQRPGCATPYARGQRLESELRRA